MSDWRMDAYYYSFTPTGVEAIDRILSAVACAGKSYHHTEDWKNDAAGYVHLRGATPVECIQNAANDAASKERIDPVRLANVMIAIGIFPGIVRGPWALDRAKLIVERLQAPAPLVAEQRGEK